jgi:hypothetical protein
VAEDFERVWTLFPRLRERQHQLGGTLSGGEQQMLAIGRALMAVPSAPGRLLAPGAPGAPGRLLGLLGRPASEYGRLRHGDGGHGRGDRRRRAFMSPILLRDVGGIGQQAAERLLEHVEHRLPVHARALHGHVRHPVGFQPIPQRQELARRRPEGLHVLGARPVGPGTRTHAATVFLCTSSPPHRSITRSITPPPLNRCRRRPEERPDHEFARRAQRQQCGVPEAPTSNSGRTRRTKLYRRCQAASAPR